MANNLAYLRAFWIVQYKQHLEERACFWTWKALIDHTREYKQFYFTPSRN